MKKNAQIQIWLKHVIMWLYQLKNNHQPYRYTVIYASSNTAFLAVIDPNDYLFTAADTGKNPCLWLLMQAFMLHIMKFVFKFFFFWKETHKGFHFQKKKCILKGKVTQLVNYSFYFLVQNKIPTTTIISYPCIVFLTVNS